MGCMILASGFFSRQDMKVDEDDYDREADSWAWGIGTGG